MKNITSCLLFALCAILMASCGSTKTQELASESSDKLCTVKISGTRATSLDPYQATIKIIGYEQSDSLVTEIFAKDLNKENVLFTWADNTNCLVTFIQQDDTKRILNISFGKDGNSLRETK